MIDTLSAGLVYAHVGLINGHTYYYQVAAVNAAGDVYVVDARNKRVQEFAPRIR